MKHGSDDTILCIDIGGTKTMVATVLDGKLLQHASAPTRRAAGPDAWLDEAVKLAKNLPGEPSADPFAVCAAVTGYINQDTWCALNPETLNIPQGFPLIAQLKERFGRPAYALNDAQAAALGEYLYGAGQGQDMVFLTVSTGIGGGIIHNGRLLQGAGGLAGHFGILGRHASVPFEDNVSGRWMARHAALQGRNDVDARTIFAQAQQKVEWAESIVTLSAVRMARMISDIQLILDPEIIVVGGSIGLADGYIERIEEQLASLPSYIKPRLKRAELGDGAGILGAAAFASP